VARLLLAAHQPPAPLAVLEKFAKVFDACEDGALNGEMRVFLKDACRITMGHAAASESLHGLVNNLIRKVNVRSSDKKLLLMDVYNANLRLHFRLGETPQFAKHMLHGLPPMEDHPLGTQVTFLFYRGRIAAASENIQEAEDLLARAYAAIQDAHPNKRQVFEYLAPIRLALGRAPSAGLLRKYGLEDQYQGLMRAVRLGSAGLVEAELKRHRLYFARVSATGTLSRLRFAAHRNLFRRVVELSGPGTTRLDMHVLGRVLGGAPASGVEDEEEERRFEYVTSVFAQLVSRGLVKGSVLSYEQATIGLSKDGPFPKLSQTAPTAWRQRLIR
jgi:hypothetical protein